MVSVLVRETDPAPIWPTGRIFVAVFAGLMILVAFLLFPGSIASKTHIALHGLCAQRPSHSLQLGGTTLPLDARMTGMYIGAAATSFWLLAIGRARATKRPARPVLTMLALFVLVLAVDGFNALAVDLGLPHPYEPSNALRLATGVLAGTTIGVALVHLIAASLWIQADRRKSVVTRPIELIAPVGIAGALGGLALSGLPVLYAPFAIGLLGAAVTVFGMMATILLALLTDRGWSCRSYRDLGALASGGLLVSMLAIGMLAWLRFFAETKLGFSQLT